MRSADFAGRGANARGMRLQCFRKVVNLSGVRLECVHRTLQDVQITSVHRTWRQYDMMFYCCVSIFTSFVGCVHVTHEPEEHATRDFSAVLQAD